MAINVKELRKKADHEYSTVVSSDNAILHLREWSPSNPTNTAILLSHGIAAHTGSYENLGKEISQLGYSCYGYDFRGHGLSDGNRGDLESLEQAMNDFSSIINFLNASHDNIILLGHSMGVTTSLLMYKNFKDSIDGLILLAGRIKVSKKSLPNLGLLNKIKIFFMSKIRPGQPIIEFPFVKEIIDTDELFVFKYTSRFFKNMKIAKLQLPEIINVPVLISVGTEDELWEVGQIREFHEKLSAPDKEFTVIDGRRHAEFTPGITKDAGIDKWLSSKFPN